MNDNTPPPAAHPPPLPKVWPYIVVGGVVALAVASYRCYHFMTDPVPLSVDDSSSPFGDFIARVFVVVVVMVSGFVGAGLGAAVGYSMRRISRRSANAAARLVLFAALIASASAQGPEMPPRCEDAIVARAATDPKLDSPLFHTRKSSYHWWIVGDESGRLEDTMDGTIDADDLLQVEQTANCISSHQGKHLMENCEAVATTDGVSLTFVGGMPAYASGLTITIDSKLSYQCSFEARYPGGTNSIKWKITRKELKLKRSELLPGSRVYGWLSISFDETDSANVTKSYKIEGYFKPVLQHKKA